VCPGARPRLDRGPQATLCWMDMQRPASRACMRASTVPHRVFRVKQRAKATKRRAAFWCHTATSSLLDAVAVDWRSGVGWAPVGWRCSPPVGEQSVALPLCDVQCAHSTSSCMCFLQRKRMELRKVS
jgi:hypothetical protein